MTNYGEVEDLYPIDLLWMRTYGIVEDGLVEFWNACGMNWVHNALSEANMLWELWGVTSCINIKE